MFSFGTLRLFSAFNTDGVFPDFLSCFRREIYIIFSDLRWEIELDLLAIENYGVKLSGWSTFRVISGLALGWKKKHSELLKQFGDF